jgi:release factor glutamine methyltransferase
VAEVSRWLGRGLAHEARWLVDHVTRGSSLAPGVNLEILRHLADLRVGGMPLQYVTGSWEFFGREFFTDRRALIPRWETEELVGMVLRDMEDSGWTGDVVDVGTGSGAIAVTIAAEGAARPGRVFALDVSEEALSLARQNADNLLTAEDRGRLTLLRSDLLSALPTEDNNQRELYIVANLPYVPTSQLAHGVLQREVHYEPVLALDGGKDGADLIRKLLESCRGKRGRLAMEVDESHAEQLSTEMKTRYNQGNIKLHPDSAGKPRFLTARLG